MSNTMTSVIHQHPKRTMTQELADAKQGDETLSQTAHRLVTEANTPPTNPTVVTTPHTTPKPATTPTTKP